MKTIVRLNQSLESLREVACNHERLPDNFVQALEESVGGKYHGHTLHDLGVVSIFLTSPKSCVTRCHRTLRLHTRWKDNSVSAALLDVDPEGAPLTLDIFPRWPGGRR